MKRYWLILLVAVAMIACPSLAAVNPNFSVQTDTASDELHYNESFHIYDSKATPIWLFGAFVLLAFVCLFASFVLTPKQRSDLFGYLAPLPFLISSLMCTGLSGIDVVNGYGVGSFTELNATHEAILMMGHNIYINDVAAAFLFIMFMISLLNGFRVYQEHELFQQSVGMGVKND